MITIEKISVKYGEISALEDVSLQIPDGEIACIVGANGAGKSTTINAISGMVPVGRGSIKLDGKPLKRSPKHIVKHGIVQVPEGRRIFPSITVLENLILGAYTIRDKKRVQQNLERAYELFPILGERNNQMGGTLSGGQQQMLAIARALMAGPKVLLLDEPSLGLAPMLVLEIFDLIRQLNDEGLTILLVEQNATKALSLADYAYVLETGRIIAEGKGEDMSKDPVVKKAYLGIQ